MVIWTKNSRSVFLDGQSKARALCKSVGNPIYIFYNLYQTILSDRLRYVFGTTIFGWPFGHPNMGLIVKCYTELYSNRALLEMLQKEPHQNKVITEMLQTELHMNRALLEIVSLVAREWGSVRDNTHSLLYSSALLQMFPNEPYTFALFRDLTKSALTDQGPLRKVTHKEPYSSRALL